VRTEGEQRAWEALGKDLDAKLLRLLERNSGRAPLGYATPPTSLGGGFWAALYAFELEQPPAGLHGPLVLRVMPTSDEQCRREAQFQSAVAARGFPAPRVSLSGGRDEGLGFPYIVMQRLPGVPLGMSALWQLPALLGTTLARLHETITEGLPEGGLERVLDDLAERTAPLREGGLGAALDWLVRTRPAGQRRVACHGDFHPLNLLIDAGGVTGVLDWTHAHVGEPEFDAAFAALMLRLWPLDKPWLPRRLLKGPLGGGTSRSFLRAYRSRAPLDEGRLAWYEALHLLRILVRVARARAGITLPPLGPRHPWELAAADASRELQARSGVPIQLPVQCALRLAS
jgi:aminoglycoside phosphotransferase (APT) family kinase protein